MSPGSCREVVNVDIISVMAGESVKIRNGIKRVNAEKYAYHTIGRETGKRRQCYDKIAYTT